MTALKLNSFSQNEELFFSKNWKKMQKKNFNEKMVYQILLQRTFREWLLRTWTLKNLQFTKLYWFVKIYSCNKVNYWPQILFVFLNFLSNFKTIKNITISAKACLRASILYYFRFINIYKRRNRKFTKQKNLLFSRILLVLLKAIKLRLLVGDVNNRIKNKMFSAKQQILETVFAAISRKCNVALLFCLSVINGTVRPLNWTWLS